MNSVEEIKAQGNSFLLKGDYIQAVQCYEEVLSRDPNDFNTIMNVSAAYHRLGDETKAGSLYAIERLATRLKGRALSRLMVAATRHYSIVGNPEQAMKELQRAQDLGVDSATLHKIRGDLCMYAEHYSAAIAEYRMSLEEKPDESDVLLQLGISLRYARDFQSASDALEQAKRLNPNDGDIEVALGQLATRTGQQDDAGYHFRRAVELNPNGARYACKLGGWHIERRDYAGARGVLEPITQQFPRSVEALCLLGIAEMWSGNARRAEKLIKQALAINPSDHRSHWALIQVSKKQKNPFKIIRAAIGTAKMLKKRQREGDKIMASLKHEASSGVGAGSRSA
jgi:tetratricopeptide (TPR) repeat protein